MKILIIDDEPYVEPLIKGWFRGTGYEFDYLENGRPLMSNGADLIDQYDLVLLDKQMPEVDGLELGKRLRELYPNLVTIMVTGYESTDALVAAFRDCGFDDYISKPFDSRKLQDALLRSQKLIQQRKAYSSEYQLNETLRLRSVERPRDLVGDSLSFQEMMALIHKFAPLDGPVLIRGETGTGKELVAREVYKHSRRSKGPFVAVNCGAIPAELFESELFGHEKGSFTGAIGKKEGLVKLADGGTLFLDEIGDTPLPLQVKLLRMLQEGEILPVGSTKTMKVNVRVISATNQALEDLVRARQFREDLLYRLNVFAVGVPSLRERRDDIPLLAQHFVEKNNNLNPQVQRISAEAREWLMEQPWEGNIRELENVVQRACALAEQEELMPRDFGAMPRSIIAPLAKLGSVQDFPEPPNYRSVEPSPGHSSGYSQLWDAFEEHGCKLWKVRDLEVVKGRLREILEGGEYVKFGHFGRIQTLQDQDLEVSLSYVSPITQSIEELEVRFQFFNEDSMAQAPISPTLKFRADHIRLESVVQPVKKGLPDTYLFNLLYPTRHRNQTISISQQHVIRALVLRYAQLDIPPRPLKKIFGEVMEFLVDEEMVGSLHVLPHDGLEAMRGCLCSKAHVFSGFSSKLKANPDLIRGEILKVFSGYRIQEAA